MEKVCEPSAALDSMHFNKEGATEGRRAEREKKKIVSQ
jgi:hypothetical protein